MCRVELSLFFSFSFVVFLLVLVLFACATILYGEKNEYIQNFPLENTSDDLVSRDLPVVSVGVILLISEASRAVHKYNV